jgi:hypothetical protein
VAIPSAPVNHRNSVVVSQLQIMDLGASVAELDHLLQAARVETSAYTDLLNDRVDLIPGTKGSGKSALFRIFVDFLPDHLLRQRRVVVAHGIQSPGDPVFHAFTDQFERLSEEEFISFWCIYLVSLAHEHFVKGERYANLLRDASNEIAAFRRACQSARIPEIEARKSLKDVLDWALFVLRSWRPKVTYKPKDGPGEIEFDLFGRAESPIAEEHGGGPNEHDVLPKYVNNINEALDSIVKRAGLSLWLMVDRLDEVFPRRSDLERRALRGLLRTMRFFSTERMRVKVFLRDDMLDQVVRSKDGFTALTHVTARQADTLRWTEDQILCMVVKRIFTNRKIADYLEVDSERLNANAEYRSQCFYRVFPPTVHRGPKQSSTLSWIYNRCSDGRGVVTPRDVLDLLIRAKQRQQDDCAANAEGVSPFLIGPSALQYGLEELSKKKRQTYLEAEFPHLWEHIEKFASGKTEYDEASIRRILGKNWKPIADDLVSIGLFLRKQTREGNPIYWVPFLYRGGLDLTQGKA